MQNIGPKLRHELKKVGQKIVFTRGENDQSILCRNKPKLLPNSDPGIYQLDCTCKRKYIGESKKRKSQHALQSIDKTALRETGTHQEILNTRDSHGQFIWLKPKTLAISFCM